jgi:MFS family permease
MIAGFVFGLMYALCAWLPNIYYMIATFGVVGGIAFSCTYLTCFIILVDYFDKKLGIANGLTMAGSGLGAFAFAPVTKLLITYFGWQNTMVIMGSITLQCCVMGALLRPVSHFKPKKSQIM